MNIWFATGNMDKKAELAAILSDWNIKTPGDAGLPFDPDETGSSFHENALIKARELYRLLCAEGMFSPGDAVIADDSGICVDALDGRPGIFSARYAGAGVPPDNAKLSSLQRNILLLEELGDSADRKARFVCAMVLLLNENLFYIANEILEGEVVKDAGCIRGSGGFGYDPVMYLPEMEKTVAELSEAEKNLISHRARAGLVIAGILGSREHVR